MKIKVSELKQLVKEAVKNVLAESAQQEEEVNEEQALREMIDQVVAEAFSMGKKANHAGGTFGDAGKKEVGPKDSHKAQPDSDSAFPLEEKKKKDGKKPAFLKDKKKDKKIEEAPKAPKSKSAFPFKKWINKHHDF